MRHLTALLLAALAAVLLTIGRGEEAVAQGGFSDAVWLLIGIASLGFLLFQYRRTPPMPVTVLLLLLSAAYLLSAAINGWSFDSLVATAKPLTALFLLTALYQADYDLEETVFWAGLMVAAIGLLAFCKLLPWAWAFWAGSYLHWHDFAPRRDGHLLVLPVCCDVAVHPICRRTSWRTGAEPCRFHPNPIPSSPPIAWGFIRRRNCAKPRRLCGKGGRF